MTIRVLVYGANGWIGCQFIDLLTADAEVEYTCGISRVDDEPSMRSEIETYKPSHIVSFIGRTHGKIGDKTYSTIDYLEQEGKLVENMRDNLYSPMLLAEICRSKQIHYTYLGTGCIFKFDDEHPFGEEVNGFKPSSLPNFFGSSYSIVKGFTDRLMSLYSDTALNVRIRMPITAHNNPRNFITKITAYQRICSIPNSMSVLPELLPCVLDMMKKRKTGTVNLTNPGLISHNEILEMYREIVDQNFTWTNFTSEEQRKILDSERSNNYLDTEVLEREYSKVSNIKDAVRRCLIQYDASGLK